MEVGADDAAVGSIPLHQPVKAREVHGANDATIAQRIGVPVGEVSLGGATDSRFLVAHEGDAGGVAAKGRAAQRETSRGQFECGAHSVAPCALVAGVVHFVEDHERVGGKAAQLLRRGWHRDLLVGGDDSVHVLGDAVGRRPAVIELQPHAVRGAHPLRLQVRGRRHNNQSPPLLCQRPARARERERCLTCTRRGDGEKVGLFARRELVERSALPCAQLYSRVERVAGGCHGGTDQSGQAQLH